ncbi:DUF4912 domain-containing protein [Ammoniphilus resinae]|uniref:DUF4912 domain-containing protein n=1 Tax=Ammoniphilus resinae TaxID=861532 RepID=A0ABS4GKC8_9BACL|nr:DUF4912 domain-containing protein [Ammoniphilus resinae]MBP1930679.1 hypothetical protein [Ammoniphilus resinae]
MVETKIKELREKKYTIEQIADELGITTGQVRYRLYKKSAEKSRSDEEESMKMVTASETGEQTTKSINDISLAIPLYYGENELRIMVQGPTSVFIYWEVTWPLMRILAEYLNTPYEDLNKLLRIFDVTDIWFNGVNAHWHRDVLVQPMKDNQFIHDLIPGRTYIVDFGIQYEGRMIPLLRSKAISTPFTEIANHSKELVQHLIDQEENRIKPRGFENFSAYTIY